MTRSSEFSVTIRDGVRVVQPDLIVHALRTHATADGPRIGLVVAKSVGGAVHRHRVSRRLRHVARGLLTELNSADLVVIRARPASSDAVSPRLEDQLRQALKRVQQRCGAGR